MNAFPNYRTDELRRDLRSPTLDAATRANIEAEIARRETPKRRRKIWTQLQPGDLVNVIRADQTVSAVPYVLRSISGFSCTISELQILDGGRVHRLCRPQPFDTSLLRFVDEDSADRKVRMIKTGMKPGRLVLDSQIRHAAEMPDLDDACRHIQNLLEVMDGGIAALVFSDFEWESESLDRRMSKLRAYVKTECELES